MSTADPEASDFGSTDAELVRFGLERLLRSRTPRSRPVLLEPSIDLPETFPEDGLGPYDALERLAPLVLDQSAQLHHPGYFAHMDPPTPSVAWVASLWQVAANQNLLHPDAGEAARALERRTIQWIAPAFGMTGGHLVPGSTVANLTALWAAREVAGVRRVVASERAHLSCRKAADILGLPFESVASDARHRIHPRELSGLEDAALVVTAGTVATGAIDTIERSGAGWLHVDAAWGGPLRFTERHRDLLEGVGAADSVGFSAHKWCYQPKGTAAVLFREADAAHAAISYGGGYLSAPNVGLLGSAPAQTVPLAATLLAWGRRGLASRIESDMSRAATLSRLVAGDARFELWAEPTSGVVVWRPVREPAAEVRSRLRDGWVSLTDIDGETWLRCVAANPYADPEHLFERVVEAL